MLAMLRHAYHQCVEGVVGDTKSFGNGLIAPVIRALERGAMKDAARLDSGCILLHEQDEFGNPYTREIRGLDLRKAIDEAIEAQGDVERIIE